MPELLDLDDVLLTPAVAAAWFDIGRRAALMPQRHQSR
jgi:hypothetical protein